MSKKLNIKDLTLNGEAATLGAFAGKAGVSRERIRKRIDHQVKCLGELKDTEDLLRPAGVRSKYAGSPGVPKKYHYRCDEWLLPGKSIILKLGKDFKSSVGSVRAAISKYARSRGLLVVTRIISEGELLVYTAPEDWQDSAKQHQTD